ncbi:3hydroxyisobutyryl-CoA hydrolase, putative [Acanthamoeba castellanii str. Neff]|uniref:3-hydroxyisobutyryl-CoA hydrolase n=1 Tax=Acanthamoeba castellanii (strain ATCC 30010 / Neff) TaxID=1257118 RepID=L8GXR1_ACACF|nr:3hydroxyisobutyryl-CoA hydrolase, putative [Acanthamoeba castellanii str. Neff]ELR17732.1 3hydroxyisobutyryl-CoA hydrolase, putative [Acanthamoeba castellanii str. Neff]
MEQYCKITINANCLLQTEVLVQPLGKGQEVVLNRPKALNALNLNMVHLLRPHYTHWEKDPHTAFVLMKGAGGKAFCAGGDIRAIYDEGIAARQAGKNAGGDPASLGYRFFHDEYVLDYQIATHPKPQVAFLNGITMGGGVGLSMHNKYKVATEHTVFAMPETAIGFFCDVGGSHFLPRLSPGFEVGMYLALTGARLKGYDLVRAGVATHYVPSSKTQVLEEKLKNAENEDHVRHTLAELNEHDTANDANSELIKHADAIHKCFGKASVEDIIVALEREGSEWATHTRNALSKLSPTALKVVFRQLHHGKQLPLNKCFEMEFRMAQRFMAGHDFFEGVRSVLVDKDRNPQWKPARLEQIADSEVDSYFEPLADPSLELHLHPIEHHLQ